MSDGELSGGGMWSGADIAIAMGATPATMGGIWSAPSWAISPLGKAGQKFWDLANQNPYMTGYQKTALQNFLSTSQGEGWAQALTPSQVMEFVSSYGPAGAQTPPNLPFMGEGYAEAGWNLPESWLPSAENVYGGGTPQAGWMWGAESSYGGGTTTQGQYGAGGGTTTEPSYTTRYLASLPQFESPAMEAYYKTQAGNIYQQYLAEQQKAAVAQRKERELALAHTYGGTLAGPSAPYAIENWLNTPVNFPSFQEYLGGTPEWDITGEAAKRMQLATKVPAYNWWEEWIKLPQRERGEYPSTFQPTTRWLSY